MLHILMYIIYFFVGIIIPLGISYLIYRWLKKKHSWFGFKILVIIPAIIGIYIISHDIYISTTFSDKEYRDDFQLITGASFPNDGKYIYRDASFHNYSMQYNSAALIEFDNSSYFKNILVEKGFSPSSQFVKSKELIKVEKKLNGINYEQILIKRIQDQQYFFAGFLNDGKSIVFASTNQWR